MTGVVTRRSSIEREYREGVVSGAKKKKGSLLKTVKAILTNRAMLVCFVAMTLSKIFFFFHISGASYFWRYYVGDIGMMAGFNTAFSLAAIVGVMTVPLFLKLFKDNKYSYCAAFTAQCVLYGISLFVVSPSDPIGTIAILAAASFFNGVSDGFIIPMFAGAADYSAWKSGNKDYGLNMAVYSVSVRAGNVLSVVIRTALLAAASFSVQVITDTGVVSDAVMTVLHDYNTLYPFICCVLITVGMLLLNPLNDKKITQYRAELAERAESAEAAAASK